MIRSALNALSRTPDATKAAILCAVAWLVCMGTLFALMWLPELVRGVGV